MNKKLFIFASVAILILLAVTCPNKKEHQDEIQQAVATKIGQGLDDNDGLSIIGTIFASKLVDFYLDSRLNVDNYVFFSLGKINYDDKNIGVSFGILHHVFIYGGGDIKKLIKEKAGADE